MGLSREVCKKCIRAVRPWGYPDGKRWERGVVWCTLLIKVLHRDMSPPEGCRYLFEQSIHAGLSDDE